MSEASAAQTSKKASKRRFRRYPVDIRVAVSVFRSGKTYSLWGRSNEFGEDGIGITLTGEIQPEEVAFLEFTVPMEKKELKIRAIVRYRDGLRHGFEFLTRTPEQVETIKRICESLALRS